MPSSYTSQTFSSTSSTINGRTTSHTQSTITDNNGTHVHQTSQQPGQALREERYEVDRSGRRVAEGGHAGRIEDVTDKEGERERERENEKRYEEAMEEEYAKREGGA